MEVIEVSFEIGNKVGGIHRVLTSKAQLMQQFFQPYLAIGFYNPEKSHLEFEEMDIPPWLEDVKGELEKEGFILHYGEWLVPGKPPAILLEPAGVWDRKNEIKYYFWEWGKVDSLRSNGWFETPAVWSYGVGKLISLLWKPGTAAIFHEWLSGGAILYLRRHAPHIPTIFHTHATVLGRTLSNAGVEIYGMIDEGIARGKVADDALAYKYGVEAKHLMEKAAARAAHVFTTVSQVTARECKYFLGREPDMVLPNGLDMNAIPPIEDLAVLHTQNEQRINEFVLAYFSPYYPIDVDNTLYFFFSGRYEVRSKGIDVLVSALGELDRRLREENSERNIVFFFWVAREGLPRSSEVLENIAMFETIKRHLEEKTQRMFQQKLKGIGRWSNDFTREEDYELRRLMYKFRREGNAPLSTHILPSDDYILRRLREEGLVNGRENRVKVVYYPAYLGPGDGLLGLWYWEAVTGTHLGVFPSYYEPWGYTPLETAAWGVPSITTDVSGFGKFIISQYGEFARRAGIMVLKRRGVSDQRFIYELADAMHYVLTLPRRQRIEKKIEAKYMAKNADWQKFIEKYVRAVELAVYRAHQGGSQSG